jgi:hypothetical protein
MPDEVAVIAAVPGAAPVRRPVVATEATAALLDVQVLAAVRSAVLPSE